MARPIHVLTPDDVLKLLPGRHSDGGGLYLQVLPGGTRSWLFRYDRHGRCHWMGLGGVDAGHLAEDMAAARAKAQQARDQLRRGEDPLASKRQREAALVPARVVPFSECATAYVAAHKDSWRSPIHARQWQQCLDDYILPKLGKLSVADIGASDVKRVLDPLWRTTPEVARKTCGKISMILNFALAHEYRSAANPASLRIMSTILGPLNQAVEHHPALPWRELPALMRKIEGRTDTPALALQWLILTCLRSKEARSARWSEIDIEKKVWTVPAERMKHGRQHAVPLSPAAEWVLEHVARLRGSPYVFTARGDKPISETSLRDLLRRCNIDGGAHVGSPAPFRCGRPS